MKSVATALVALAFTTSAMAAEAEAPKEKTCKYETEIELDLSITYRDHDQTKAIQAYEADKKKIDDIIAATSKKIHLTRNYYSTSIDRSDTNSVMYQVNGTINYGTITEPEVQELSKKLTAMGYDATIDYDKRENCE